MKRTILPCLAPFATLLFCACTSSSASGPDAATTGSGSSTIDAPAETTGFTIDIGQQYHSSGMVEIGPVTEDGVYAGYFQAKSDLSSTPNLSVSIVANSGALSTGTYPCARSQTDDSFDETSVLIQWLDGDDYYTNVSTAMCTIDVTAASDASVSATISGEIYDESGVTATSFTASFVATVR